MKRIHKRNNENVTSHSSAQKTKDPRGAWPADDIGDFRIGTWKLPGDKLIGLPAGTYEVKVTAKNSIELVRTDSTANELTVTGSVGK